MTHLNRNLRKNTIRHIRPIQENDHDAYRW
jgi:hypothetical protein